MNDSNFDRINVLTREANSLPYGEVQVRLRDEAVKLADAARDLNTMFQTRLDLMHSACFSGHPEKALTAFAWCLAHFERKVDQFQKHEGTLLWYFKNVLHNADEFPQMTRDQIEQLREQMASHYRRCGYNMRPVHYTRLVFAIAIGDRQLAAESYTYYRSLPRDSMADCLACEADTEVEYFDLLGEHEKAVEVAGPSISGRRSCHEVPHRTYCYVLRPLALLGRHDEADECQRKGYRLIRNNPGFLSQIALQVAYLLHRNREQPALRMFEKHLSWAIDTHQLRSRYLFYVSARHTLNRFVESKPTQKLNLPRSLPVFSDSGRYDLAPLIGWLDGELNTLGERFDARNENRFFTQDLVNRLLY
jgi:tetratricopeptide (TPR) repeat protein